MIKAALPPQSAARAPTTPSGASWVVMAVGLALGAWVPGAAAAAARLAKIDAEWLDIEQLSQIRITTASKKEEPLSATPAAVSVVTREDLQRTWATSVPEALRHVPGVEAAQINSSGWAVTVRGLNGSYANQLLVLQDGRSIYSPVFGGVKWAYTQIPLEEIERIEVVRGPGGSLWGANAVQGVIDIVTRNARDTQGAYVSAGGGNEKNLLSYGRYGFQIGEKTWARVYGSYTLADEARFSDSTDAGDGWWNGQAGFRLDSDLSDVSRLMFQTGLSVTRMDDPYTYPNLTTPPVYQQPNPNPDKALQAHVLGKWTRDFSATSILNVQAFYARDSYEGFSVKEVSDTLDLDLSHQFDWGRRQSLVWGLGGRVIFYDLHGKGNGNASFPAEHPSDQIVNAFVQDEIHLVPDRLSLTLGAKVEHNNYTGWEVQPSARLAWKLSPSQMFWGAISRTVRTPSQVERNVVYGAGVFPSTPPTFIQQIGNPDLGPENQSVYELGYRAQPRKRLSLDAALYHSGLDHMFGAQMGGPDFSKLPAYVRLPVGFVNAVSGRSYGAELAVNWQPLEAWKLYGYYTYSRVAFDSSTAATSSLDRNSPLHQAGLRTSVDFGKHWMFDAGVRYVDALRNGLIPGYATADARLAWRPNQHWEVSVAGRNLLDAAHPEFGPPFLGRVIEIPRSIYGKVTWRF